jgi:hypothetical protein
MDPETELKAYVRRELGPFICRTLDPYLARGVIPARLVKTLRKLDKDLGFGLAFVQSEAEIQALIAALHSPNVMRQIGAAQDAAWLAPDPALVAALHRVAAHDSNYHVRVAARETLEKIAPAELVEVYAQDQTLKTSSPFEVAGIARSDGTVVFDAPMFSGALHSLFALLGLGCAFCLWGGLVLGQFGVNILGNFSFEGSVLVPIVMGLVFAGAGLWNLFRAFLDFEVPDVIFDPPHRKLRLQTRFRPVTEFSFDEIVEIRIHPFRTRYGEEGLTVSIGMVNQKEYKLTPVQDRYHAVPLLRWLVETLGKPIAQRELSVEWADLLRDL